MNKKILLSCFSGAILLFALSVVATRGGAEPSPITHLEGVRAEYVDLSGNWYHIDTTCHLINTSFTTPIVLGDVLVLGPDGRRDVIATHTALNGTVLMPLGELRLAIDSSIPGVLPQTSVDATGVRTVVFAWDGATGSLNLSAVLERHPHSGTDPREHLVVEGYEVVF